MDEDPFRENTQGITKNFHQVLFLMKFPQTKPTVKNMNIIYCDLYYTVIKNRDEKGILDNQYEKDYINFDDIIPNHYIERKNFKEMLK